MMRVREEKRAEVAELVRVEVHERGYRRVALLGEPEDMAGSWLRRPLAASGILVMAPGERDRMWIGELIAELSADEGMSDSRRTQLKDLVEHATQHGAQAVIVTSGPLMASLAELGLGVPILDVRQLVP